MKFRIRRASARYNDQEPPVRGARRIDVTVRRDSRTFKNIAAWKKKFPEDFEHPDMISFGSDRDGVYRLMKCSDSVWIIDVECLCDLLKMVEKEGDIIIRPKDNSYPEACSPVIQIYDDYIE